MKFLLGNFGSGKTSTIIQNSLELQENFWVISPSRRHKDQLYFQLLSQKKGLIGNPIITLSELHKTLLDHIFGTDQPRTLSNFEQFLIISHIIQKNSNNFLSFKNISQRPEMIKMIYRLIQGLRNKNIQELESSPALKDKIHDLQLILNEFQDILSQKQLCDAQEEVNLLIKNELDPQILPENIFIDGFVDFTPIQFSLIRYIGEQAEKHNKNITITLTDNSHPLSQETITEFKKHFPKAEIQKLTHESKGSVLANSFLENTAIVGEIPKIHEIQTFGKHKEIEEIANQIKKLCLYENHSLEDIIVITKQQDIYAPLIHSVFNKMELPFVLGKDHILSRSPLILFIKKLLSFHLDDFTHETLEFFANSNYIKPEYRYLLMKSVDLIPIAIQGNHKVWKERLEEYKQQFLIEEHKEDFIKLEELINTLCTKLFKFSIYKEYSIDDFINHLIDLLDFLGVFEALNIQEEQITSYNQHKLLEEAFSKDYAGIHKFKEILSQLKQALLSIDQSSLSLYEFIFHINIICDETRYRNRIPSHNSIRVLSPEDTRGSFAKTIFILGMNEGEFPSPPRFDLFDSQDRNHLNNLSKKFLGTELWETEIDYFSKEKLSFATALSRALENIYFSRTPVNERGVYFGVSHFLKRILEKTSSFKRIPNFENISLAPHWDNPHIFKTLYPAQHYYEFRQLSMIEINQSPQSQKSKEYIRLIKEANESFNQDEVSKNESLAYFGFFPNTHVFAQKYAEDEISISPTGLETFGRCRYAGLWKKIFKLKKYELPTYTPEAADYGTLYHSVLERYINETKELSVEDFYQEELLHQVLKDCINEFTQQRVFLLDYNYLFTILSNFLKNTEKEFRKTQQSLYFELDSGDKDLPNHLIPIGNKYLKTYCKIDRVDQDLIDNGFHILDYKKGGAAYKYYQKIPFNLFQGFLYAALLSYNQKNPINSIKYVLLEKNEIHSEYPLKSSKNLVFNSIEEFFAMKKMEAAQLISLLEQGNFSPFTLSDDIGEDLYEIFAEKYSDNFDKEYTAKCSYCDYQKVCLRKNKLYQSFTK